MHLQVRKEMFRMRRWDAGPTDRQAASPAAARLQHSPAGAVSAEPTSHPCCMRKAAPLFSRCPLLHRSRHSASDSMYDLPNLTKPLLVSASSSRRGSAVDAASGTPQGQVRVLYRELRVVPPAADRDSRFPSHLYFCNSSCRFQATTQRRQRHPMQ